jgi:hypothetical protein
VSWMTTQMKPVKVCTENDRLPISDIYKDVPWRLSGGTKQACIVAASFILSNNVNTVVEIGTQYGFSTLILARALLANSDNPLLITIDMNPRALERSKDIIKDVPIDYRTICADSRDATLELDGKIGLAFIDGCHEYEWIKHDLNMTDEIMEDYGIFVCHDYSKTQYNGVYRYINEFVESNGYPMFFLNENRFSADYRTAIIQKSGNYIEHTKQGTNHDSVHF